MTNTTLLRVAAFKANQRVSAMTTYSYILLDQVLHQPANPPGLPSGSSAWNGYPSAWQMDPRVVNDPAYRDRMKDALKALPIVSLVCSRDDLFSTQRGLYFHTTSRGDEWERACSAEMILTDGTTAFQIDCGLRAQGNSVRIPLKSPKHSFRLVFRESYGAKKLHHQVFPDSPLKKFDSLVLRADYNNSWIHRETEPRARAQRTRDAWMKDSHRAMGWIGSHSRYVHLFLNGMYWGIYDLAERPDAEFAAAYLGGAPENYDVVNCMEAKDGTLDAFRELHSLRGFTSRSQYEKLQQRLDLAQFIDYLLLNYYAGNQDWGENKNWYAIRRHTPPGPFQFFVWDGEQVLHDVSEDTVSSPYETPFQLAEDLKRSTEFRLAFADRVQKHFFNEGALTSAASLARWMQRSDEVDLAMIAESARWGYYRRNTPYTRDRDWAAEQRRLVMNYFPQRASVVLGQLRAAGLYPKLEAPVFHQHGGQVTDGFKLAIAASGDGKIYFTTNNTDPRMAFTGEVAKDVMIYSEPMVLPVPSTVKARLWKEGAWSAMNEAGFTKTDASQ